MRNSDIERVLLARFGIDEMKRLARHNSGQDISNDIGWNQSAAAAAYAFVDSARRHGILPHVLALAASQRPGCADVAEAAAAFPLRPGQYAQPMAPAHTPATESAPATVYETTPEVLQAINAMLDAFEPIGKRSVYWLLQTVMGRIGELVGLEDSLRAKFGRLHHSDPLRNPSVAKIMDGAAGYAEVARDIRWAAEAAALVASNPPPPVRRWDILRRGGLDATETRFAREPLAVITSDHVNGILSLEADLSATSSTLASNIIRRAMCIGRQDGEDGYLTLAHDRLRDALGRVQVVSTLLKAETKAEVDPFDGWG